MPSHSKSDLKMMAKKQKCGTSCLKRRNVTGMQKKTWGSIIQLMENMQFSASDCRRWPKKLTFNPSQDILTQFSASIAT